MTAPPSAPGSLRVTSILRDSVTLAWEEPATDGGSPITGYVIERHDTARMGWTTVGTVNAGVLKYQVRKLLEGNEYNFRVMAENLAGTGEPIESSQAVEIKSPFGKLLSFLKIYIDSQFRWIE